MGSHSVISTSIIINDLIRMVGGSFWFWMVLDALKPGLVSFYWDLPLHGFITLILIVMSVIVQRNTPVIINASV